ncbi:MAG: hypothetical protein GX567_17880 [Clostridia bacterium]|nr:hypothetical protein [Clostridia bacterium]HKM21836.1 DUF6077 domain-containing protein [Lachnospiraceae bacterium]
MILSSILCIILNFIMYTAFGSLVTRRKKGEAWSLPMTVIIGFFLYYSLFFFFCVPMMLRFQTLTSMSYLWLGVVVFVVLLSGILNGSRWYYKIKEIGAKVKAEPVFFVGFVLLCLIQVILVVNAYNFTLDATYYVGNVAASVQTDTMNIYDPYTGMWQDHFEMRYFFATYSMNDAVMCRLTGLHALVQTKTIMTATIIILIQLLYYKIAQALFDGNRKSELLMLFFMTVANFAFISLYTPSNFLLTRTFEGKAIVGNLVLVAIVYLYMMLLQKHQSFQIWMMLFLICFGATTISSSANMLVPATLSVLLIPLVFIKKDWKIIPKYIICMLPGLIMALTYVAYVKGYFVIHTY